MPGTQNEWGNVAFRDANGPAEAGERPTSAGSKQYRIFSSFLLSPRFLSSFFLFSSFLLFTEAGTILLSVDCGTNAIFAIEKMMPPSFFGSTVVTARNSQ